MNMTKLAKIISIVLTVAMVLGLCATMLIPSSAAVTAPKLSLTKNKIEGKELYVNVNLESGTFNAMDIYFNTKGLECVFIIEGDASKGGTLVTNPAAKPGFSHIGMASSGGFKNKGVIATVIFEIKDSDYSVSMDITSCNVTEKDANGDFVDNVSVTPTILSNLVASSAKPSTPKPSSSSATSKSSSSSSSKQESTTKKTTTTSSTTVPVTPIPSDVSSTESSTSISEIPSDTNPDFDEYSNDYYYTDESQSETQAVSGETQELLNTSIDKKTIIIIVAIIVVVIAAAVVGFVFINNKKEKDDLEDIY